MDLIAMIDRYSPKRDIFSPSKMFTHPEILNALAEIMKYSPSERTDEVIFGHLMSIPVITGEMSPSTRCNETCEWCMHSSYFDNKKGTDLDIGLGKKILSQLKDLGMKSMIYAASGEPYMNPQFNNLLKYGNELDLKQAVVTNGSKLKDEDIEPLVKYATWTRISLDATTPETRKNVHGVDNFETVRKNLEKLAIMKESTGSNIDIGAQFIVCPSNAHELKKIAQVVEDTGIDYVQIKPIVYHPMDGKPQESLEFFKEALGKAFSAKNLHEDDKFKVHVKDDQFNAIMDPNYGRTYNRCLAVFFPIIEADGKVYHCSQTRGLEDFCIGDLTKPKSSFEEIWKGERRRKLLLSIDIDKCQPVCRNHVNNNGLEGAINPENEKDFI